MDPIHQRTADSEPLTSLQLVEARVASLIGRAQARQVWLLFLLPDDVQSPLIMPVSDAPLVPCDADLPAWSRVIHDASEAVGATAVVVVLERVGAPRPTPADRAWARLTVDACRDAGIALRAVVLSHRRGVALLEEEDYGPVTPD
jgi:hypothetical protein